MPVLCDAASFLGKTVFTYNLQTRKYLLVVLRFDKDTDVSFERENSVKIVATKLRIFDWNVQ